MALIAALRANEAEQFDLPPGFAIIRFADDALAHDIFSLAIDADGRVVVSGPGYIKRLWDDDNDGRADRARRVSDFPASGAQGMYFDGRDLIVTGDNVLAWLRDNDADGTVDGKPEIWARLKTSEHGGHAVVLGPDGWFYVVCGNDAAVSADHATASGSPISRPRCGAILRVSRDGRRSQVIADGFRNPYDIAFAPDGNLFTVDSDGERDHHLPWYAPTRLFDVALGREHGWLAGGWINSWSRPEWFYDNVPRGAELGRGSPTGIACYRHRQFPARYRGGLFSADWTFGRIYFLPLVPAGSSFRGQPEIFLQSRGDQGFNPVDLAVGPAGDLFIAMGGRRTQGSVFRVSYRGPATARSARSAEGNPRTTPLMAVLDAAEPLSSWSRARWVPAARALGPEPFYQAAADADLDGSARGRALEVLVELFGGVDTGAASRLLGTRDACVQARLAWALGHGSGDGGQQRLLARLTQNADPVVRRAAWESLLAVARLDGAMAEVLDWRSGLGDTDDRVRWAAMLTARRLRPHGGSQLAAILRTTAPPRLALARFWIAPEEAPSDPAAASEVLSTCQNVLKEHLACRNAESAPLALEALRLLQVAGGDVQIERHGPGMPVGFVLRRAADLDPARCQAIAQCLVDAFPTGDRRVDFELARVLAMFQAQSHSLPKKLIDRCDAASTPQDDLHYLFALSRVAGPRSAEVTRATARALLQLDLKLRSRRELVSRNWPDQVQSLCAGLCAGDPSLPAALVSDASFGRPMHALFALRLPDELKPVAARRFLAAASSSDDDQPAWTPELVDLIATLPDDEALPALRARWTDAGPRDRIALALAARGRPEDRDRLVEALASVDQQVVARCASALCSLPAAAGVDDYLLLDRSLRRFCAVSPIEHAASATVRPNAEARRALAQLFAHWSGEHFAIDETPPIELTAAYAPIFAWIRRCYPQAARRNLAGADADAWASRLARINWAAGDRARGRAVFEKQACHRCHAAGTRATNPRLGPDLAGAANRMSREDLFAAIIYPSRDVSPAYRTTSIVTRAGRVYQGIVVYESPDGTLLQTSPDVTVRITGQELLSMEPGDRSLMPDGLLNDLSDGALADLYAYLKGLTAAE
jgi:putative membrane-bound dehydrogenase-like protein